MFERAANLLADINRSFHMWGPNGQLQCGLPAARVEKHQRGLVSNVLSRSQQQPLKMLTQNQAMLIGAWGSGEALNTPSLGSYSRCVLRQEYVRDEKNGGGPEEGEQGGEGRSAHLTGLGRRTCP